VRKMLLGVGVGLVLAVLFLSGRGYLGGKMVKAKNMRFIVDATMIVTALEQYKTQHGVYPAAMEARGLEAALVPAILRSLPRWGLSYFSDGTTYTLLIRPAGDGPHAVDALGLIEIRDGRWVSWPDWLTEDELKRYLHEQEPPKTSTTQPNNRLQATVGGLGGVGPARSAFAPRA
jgi:hypothetical protein